MFKDKLRQLRKDNNLTQEALANVICVSRSAINKWEQGNGIPSDVNLKSLCEHFNVTEEWLLDREDLKEYIKTLGNNMGLTINAEIREKEDHYEEYENQNQINIMSNTQMPNQVIRIELNPDGSVKKISKNRK